MNNFAFMRLTRLALVTCWITLSCFFIVGYTACIEDTCKDFVCNNGGICVNKACACPSGFYGPLCEVAARDAFLGNWNVEELVNPGQTLNTYALLVAGNDNSGILLLNDFMGVYDSVVCQLNTRYTFQINPGQQLSANLYLASGTGTFDTLTGKVTVAYSFMQDSVNRTASATWTR